MIKEQMEKIYRTISPEKIPWNLEIPPDIIQNIVKSGRVKPCKAIELGCGTGNYVIYLSSMDFNTTGVDISITAIEMAKKSATEKKIKCNFITADVLGEMAEIQSNYDFAYDWELLHHIFPEEREKYITNVYKLLNPGGKYLSVCFSEKSPQFGGAGKYRKTPFDTVLYFSSDNEMVNLFQTLFEIEELKTVTIQGKYTPHKVIYAFLKKR
ncbi:MAG: class I SAM-dependent methyltransferase [Bacteroidetes bacterium]|nr:class I SAM-dependent methyltransferase [Bacteroidota bacterium]MBL7104684.1 class I SAM-dependent methyltransferase [Bacteroidales bacterium]